MPFTLPPLPYAYDALEPHIDARTMEIHHDKHHAAYVENLNKALEKHPDLSSKTIEQLLTNLNDLPIDIKTAVINQGGGHYNHTLFWQMLKNNKGKISQGLLHDAIVEKFGSFDQFKTEFSDAAKKVFGSGWAWLCLDAQGKLAIISSPNQENPISKGIPVILGLDVWEHAYYLKYQNRRPDYIQAWWQVVNWDWAESHYESLR